MAKKQFKAESKRLLDLMINSIYTHQEIFLREIISNASDAIDKLAYQALTDEKVGLSRSDFAIELKPDETARTLTVSDNGIGMDRPCPITRCPLCAGPAAQASCKAQTASSTLPASPPAPSSQPCCTGI